MRPPALRGAVCVLLGAATALSGNGRSGRTEPAADPRGDPPVVERQAYLMGTRVVLATIAGDRSRGLRTLEGMLSVLESVEAELSTWRDDSLLSAINRQPVGTPYRAPSPVCRLLVELGAWQRATGGAFDPGVGTLIAAWGLREEGRRPGRAELEEALRDAGLRLLTVERDPCRVTRCRGVLLDAGAFGKGLALDRVAESLASPPGPWMIDLGGQIAVGGLEPSGWPVAIAHPRRRGEVALELRLTEGSLATSGGSERDLRLGDETLGHIVDPRSGRPVSRPGSVTVWHRRALVADVLSTALYVMGADEGLAWAEARGLAACFIASVTDGALSVRATAAFRNRFLTLAQSRPRGRAHPAAASPSGGACASASAIV